MSEKTASSTHPTNPAPAGPGAVKAPASAARASEAPAPRSSGPAAPEATGGRPPASGAVPGVPASRRGSRMFPDGTGPSPDPAGSHFERRIRSFQPRRSRVTVGQADALRRLWPVWGLDIDGQRVLDLDGMFDGLPVVLEIGFG
ncbi:tRNA (guanosine(46)-N7)-methyltransferase TrmB, partial [Streptomyces roseolilacinus]